MASWNREAAVWVTAPWGKVGTDGAGWNGGRKNARHNALVTEK